MDNVDNSLPDNLFRLDGATLAVFAKQPVPGKVKTRLCPPLTPEQACRLYEIALRETLARLQQAPVTLVLCYAGEPAWFAENFPGLPLLPQADGDLGERLTAASQALFAAGAKPLLLAGSDSPDLPLDRIDAALAELSRTDVVCVPCRDGGYALIGQQTCLPELFAEIPWSTDQVLSVTRQRTEKAGLGLVELEPWDDLDDFAALQRLVKRSPESATARALHEPLFGLPEVTKSG